ncbi:MAG: polysaccharide biosynthesis/export family protein [Sphingomonadales bacterium]
MINLKILSALVIAIGANAVQAQTQSAAPTSSEPARAYTLNPGDEIEIYVWGEDRLQRSLKVLPDGSFSFPLIGRVVAQGKTLREIEATVTKGLESQYRGQVPQVTVSVKASLGLQFSVAGRVKAPGTFTPGRYVNLLEAITLAGGPDEFANLDNVLIVRKAGTGVVTVRAKLSGLFRGNVPGGGLTSANLPAIEGGDTVIVP